MAFDLSGLRLSDVFGAVNQVSARAYAVPNPITGEETDDSGVPPVPQYGQPGGTTDTPTDTGEGTYGGSPLEEDEPFSPGMSFPVPGYEDAIQDDFGEPREYRGGIHEGTDIVAPEGTDVAAPVAGTIDSIHSSTNGGNIIWLLGQDGRTYKFMHLSGYAVDVGATVSAGQTIGYVGDTGYSSTPHLHFEIHEGGVPVNPHDWLMGVAEGSITGATEEAAEPKLGRFENESPTTFTAIEEWVKREAWGGEFSGFTDTIGLFVDAWGNRFYGDNGRWPEPQEMISDMGFYNAAMLQPFSAKYTGPTIGVVNAPDGRFFYTNDPVFGMQFNPVGGPRPGIDIAYGNEVDPSEVEFIPAPGQEGASVLEGVLGGEQSGGQGGGTAASGTGQGGGGGARTAEPGTPLPASSPAPPSPRTSRDQTGLMVTRDEPLEGTTAPTEQYGITPSADAGAGSAGQNYPPAPPPPDPADSGWVVLKNGTRIPASVFNRLLPEDQIKLTGVATFTTNIGSTVTYQPTPEVVPTISYDDFLGYAGGSADGGKGGGGGGGGGGKGAGQAKLTFDKAALIESASNMWFALLLQTAPEKEITRIVESFMRDAQAFYQGDGGQLDFETFLRNEIRRTDKHKVLYQWKPKGMLEEEYLRPYAAASAQFGLAPAEELKQARISAGTGAAPVEQAQRISRSRTVMNQSGFSGRLAQFVSSLGPGMG